MGPAPENPEIPRAGRQPAESKREGTTSGAAMAGVGLARLNPAGSGVLGIGDELATERALADLAHQLIEATSGGHRGIHR
ncbi:dsRBD fold-containing protein [Arthrobacter cupressi]|uniref:dsRBD fold-containing protein n=1 Tax=Arthrobacter cupressi TaxID=1045773 RepID=UPI0009FC050D